MKTPPPFDVVDGAAGTPGRASSASMKTSALDGSQRGRTQRSRRSWPLGVVESSLGEFDRARVEAIRRAIRDGHLTIDPYAIADRMVAASLSLIRDR